MFSRAYHKLLGRLRSFHPPLYAQVFKYRRAAKYVVAGGTAAAVDLVLLYILNEWLDVWYLSAAVLAFIIAFGVSFSLQKFWTFRDRSRERMHAQAAVYFAVSVGNLILNTALIYAFVDFLRLYVIVAQIIAGILIACSSFFIYRRFIFNKASVSAVGQIETASAGGEANKFFFGAPLYLVLIALALYLPVFGYFHSQAKTQIAAGDNPRFVLPVYGSDSEGYVRIADDILYHGVFSEDQAPPYKPDTFRTPGYPALLALFKRLSGSYEFFPLLQVAFTIASAIMIFKMGKRLWSGAVGFGAATLFLIDPTTIFHTLILMSDITYVFLLLVVVYVLFFTEWRSVPTVMIVAGVLLGLSTLVRPISMFLVALLLLFWLWRRWREWPISKMAAMVIIFVAAYAAVVMPWVARNHEASGVWGISSVKDFNFFHYNIPEFLAYKNHITPDAARLLLQKDILPVAPYQESDLRYSPVLNHVWMKYFWQTPVSFTAFYFVKTAPFFLSSSLKAFYAAENAIAGSQVFAVPSSNLTNILLHGRLGEFFSELARAPLLTLEEIFWAVVFVLMFVPLFRKTSRFYVWLLIFLVLYFALLTGVVAYPRFRLPAEPFLLLLACQGAAMAFSDGLGFVRRGWRKRRAPAVATH